MHVVLDDDGERVDGNVRRQGRGLSGVQVEQRAVARAFDGARLRIELALGQRAVVVRAAVLDGEDLAVAVEDADLEVLPFDDAGSAGRELGERADVDESAGHVRRRAKSVLDGMNCTDRASGAPAGPDDAEAIATRARRARCGAP